MTYLSYHKHYHHPTHIELYNATTVLSTVVVKTNDTHPDRSRGPQFGSSCDAGQQQGLQAGQVATYCGENSTLISGPEQTGTGTQE